MVKVYIELTEEQKVKLFPIQDKLMKSNRLGKPDMVIAQVLFTGRDAVAVVGIIDHEKALKIQNALGMKSTTKTGKPKMTTDKMTQRRLAKARI